MSDIEQLYKRITIERDELQQRYEETTPGNRMNSWLSTIEAFDKVLWLIRQISPAEDFKEKIVRQSKPYWLSIMETVLVEAISRDRPSHFGDYSELGVVASQIMALKDVGYEIIEVRDA